MAQATPISRNSPPPSAANTRTDSGFRIGQQVSHTKFGQGVIINADGSGKNVQVEVNFRDHGIKRLALEYAGIDGDLMGAVAGVRRAMHAC